MIATFPDPYEGELLFSVIARFSERMDFPALYMSQLELFGVRHGIPAIELPNRIDQLVSALPPSAVYTSDWIIEKNTLLPLYAPFLPERNYDLVRQNMKGGEVRTTQLRAGIIAGGIRAPEFFRSCPICDEENFTQVGETYWKRVHQISGIEVCPVHAVFLEPTSVRLRGAGQKDALIAAQSAQRVMSARKIDPQKLQDRVLLHIAKSACWLLDTNTSRPGLAQINRGYRQVLASSGCISPGGWIRLKRLRKMFADCCPEEFLKSVNCEMRDARDGGWLARLLRETEHAVAPLRHLILMAVLNVSAEEFFTQILPGAVGKRHPTLFPCLNSICPQSRAPVIPGFEIKRAKHGCAHLFECPHCGHRSSRSVDGQSVIRVVNFGQLWEQKLKEDWRDTSLSLRSIAAKLGADSRSVLKYAVKLGLGFPRHGPSRLTRRYSVRIVKRPPRVSLIEEKRKAWHQLQVEHPRAGVGELHRLASALYTWLYRNDRTWMVENSPSYRPFVPKNDRVDWAARDAELVGRVIEAAGRIMRDLGPARRVTVRSIGLELRMHALLQIHKNKLPRTKLALDAHVESTEQFCLRRIRHVVDGLKLQRVRATRSDIMRSAGIGSRALQIPSVVEAVNRATDELDPSLRVDSL